MGLLSHSWKQLEQTWRKEAHELAIEGINFQTAKSHLILFLQTLDDTDGGHSLPFGPVFMSPKTMAEAALEAFVTGPEYQKADTLKAVLSLFPGGAEMTVSGAYGNKASDVRAYRAAGVPSDRVFIVDTEGRLRRVSDGREDSYNVHADRVDDLYPKLWEE